MPFKKKHQPAKSGTNIRREPHQKKKVINKKSLRGQPETEYCELKKIVSYSLTPTGAELLKGISKQLEISTSEMLEQIARGRIQLQAVPHIKDINAKL